MNSIWNIIFCKKAYMIITLWNKITLQKYSPPTESHRADTILDTFSYQEVAVQVSIGEWLIWLRIYIPVHIYAYETVQDLSSYIHELFSHQSVVVILPALTWTSALIVWSNEKWTQWAGWANCRFKTGIFVDDVVIWLDYIWSQWLSTTGQRLQENWVMSVSCVDQVTYRQRALSLIWVYNIKTLIWWSNGWFHVHRWLMQQTEHLFIDHAVIIASPVMLSQQEREYMQIQIDLWENRMSWVAQRLWDDMKPLLWISVLFDYCVHQIVKICDVDDLSESDRLRTIRMIGFLRFLRPEYYEKFWKTREGDHLDLVWAQANIRWRMNKQANVFESRFSLHGIVSLKRSLVDVPDIHVHEYVQSLQNVRLTLMPIIWDTIFDSKSMYDLYVELDKTSLFHRLIEVDGHDWGAGHDAFLWPQYSWKFVEWMRT